jgi:hypothetical protein
LQDSARPPHGGSAGSDLISSGPGFRSPAQMALWNESMDGMLTFSGLDPSIATLIHVNDSSGRPTRASRADHEYGEPMPHSPNR